MELCENQINLIILVVGFLALLAAIFVPIILHRRKNKREKEEQAPTLTRYGWKGDFNSFHFVLRNDGPTRVKKIEEPKYDKESIGEFDIRGEYLFNPRGPQGEFYFSKSALAPGDQFMIIFRKRNDERPYNYKGEWKIIISYEGDFFKPKPLPLKFEVDASNRTIIPIDFK